MLLFRGVGATEAAFYGCLAPGSIVAATCFVSASLLQDTAQAAAASQPGGTTIEVVLRKGQKGVADINPFLTYPYRPWEVLINIGTSLRVAGASVRVLRLKVIDGNDLDERDALMIRLRDMVSTDLADRYLDAPLPDLRRVVAFCDRLLAIYAELGVVDESRQAPHPQGKAA
jgi:hypothetical protein